MGESKHTPGPWKLDSEPHFHLNRVWTQDMRPIVSILPMDTGLAEYDQESLANARLIASAPDLLAALQKIAGGKEVEDPYHPEQTITVCWSAEEIDGICQDAIAKAEGR